MMLMERSEEVIGKLRGEVRELKKAIEKQEYLVEGRYGYEGLVGRVKRLEELIEQVEAEMHKELKPLQDIIITVKTLRLAFGALGITAVGVVAWLIGQFNG